MFRRSVHFVSVQEKLPRLPSQCHQTSHHLFPVLRRFPWHCDRPIEASPFYRHEHKAPKTAMSYQTSPSGTSSFSGPADQWTPLSSRPCLPMLSEDCYQQGPFAPRTLLRFIANTNPSATLS